MHGAGDRAPRAGAARLPPPVRLATPRLLIDDPDADFTGPRWSPDGTADRRRAAARRRLRTGADRSRDRRASGRSPRARDARLVTPSWTPDGATVLFAADLGDAAVQHLRRRRRRRGAVQAGDRHGRRRAVSRAVARRIAHLRRLHGGRVRPVLAAGRSLPPEGGSYGSGGRPEIRWRRSHGASAEAAEAGGPASKPDDRRRPQSLSAPAGRWSRRYWTPVVETDAGEIAGRRGDGDVRRARAARLRGRRGVDAARARGPTGTPPTPTTAGGRRSSPATADDTDPIRGGTVRSRELFAGALLPFRHLRWTETLLGGIRRADRHGRLHDDQRDVPRRRSAGAICVRCAAAGCTTAAGCSATRSAPRKASRVEAAAETSRDRARIGRRRRRRGRSTSARISASSAATPCSPAGSAAAAGWGRAAARRAVLGRRVRAVASRSSTSAATPSACCAASPPEDVVGTRAAVANLDLRFPLARVQRGAGAWPIFVRTRPRRGVRRRRPRLGLARSAPPTCAPRSGGELSLDVVVLHYLPLTIVSGAAWTRDPVAGREPRRVLRPHRLRVLSRGCTEARTRITWSGCP